MQIGIKYDFIGRLENFWDDVRVLEDRISPEFTAFLRPDFRNATDATTEIPNYMTSELREAIYRKFRVDFEHFRYELS
jgi:hypothetical protein